MSMGWKYFIVTVSSIFFGLVLTVIGLSIPILLLGKFIPKVDTEEFRNVQMATNIAGLVLWVMASRQIFGFCRHILDRGRPAVE